MLNFDVNPLAVFRHLFKKVTNTQPCDCAKYKPIVTWEDVIFAFQNASAASIIPTLEFIAADDTAWVSVYQCKMCKHYWAHEAPGSKHPWKGWDLHRAYPISPNDCFYPIDTDNPLDWLKSPEAGLSYCLYQKHTDRIFCQRLILANTTEVCDHEGCTNERVLYSLMCKKHHFEHIRKRPYPFD